MSTKTIERGTEQRMRDIEKKLDNAMKMIQEYQDSHANLQASNGELAAEIEVLKSEMDIREGRSEMEQAEGDIRHVWNVIRAMGGWLALEIAVFVMSVYMSLSDQGPTRMTGVTMAVVVFSVFVGHVMFTYRKLRSVEKMSIRNRAKASQKLQRGYSSKAQINNRPRRGASAPL